MVAAASGAAAAVPVTAGVGVSDTFWLRGAAEEGAAGVVDGGA